VRFRVLGPLDVLDDDGRPVAVTAPRLRLLLATLLVAAHREVPVGELAETLWPDDPPACPRNAVQASVRRLRALVGRSRIETGLIGYRIRLQPAELDVTQFRAAVEQARSASDPADRTAVLEGGLRLWRGTPLEEFAGVPLVRDAVAGLADEWLAAVELSIAARIELGHHHELVPELRTLTRAHPAHEGLWGHLMVALHHTGRQSEALAAYDELAANLADELGIDPGPGLRDVRQSVLTGRLTDQVRCPFCSWGISSSPVVRPAAVRVH
jgi:DNA-binding SARP family transcriptional activator